MCLVASLTAANAWAVGPPESDPSTFFKPELYISTSSVELSEVLPQLANRATWEAFYGERGEDAMQPRTPAWIDPRSGTAVNILLSEPILRGEVTPAAVGALVGKYVTAHRDIIGIDPQQLGDAMANEATAGLWHVSIPQRFEGVPVRYGRVLATITKGNLVLLGTETWGDVRGLTTRPRITGGQALQAGYNHLQALASDAEIVREPSLEIVPYAPPELQHGEGYGGPVGEGYRHRLAWTYVLKQPGEIPEYEAIVDAATGELLSFQDVVEYVDRQVRGGIYPFNNNGSCGDPAQCGSLQPLTPMPFADTGRPAPNNFTNSAGVFDWTSGPVSTTLTGRFVDVVDRCGTISETASSGGTLNLGGVNGQHDCTASGSSDGNTPASRTAYYELNRIQEMARGWLPNNAWLGTPHRQREPHPDLHRVLQRQRQLRALGRGLRQHGRAGRGDATTSGATAWTPTTPAAAQPSGRGLCRHGGPGADPERLRRRRVVGHPRPGLRPRLQRPDEHQPGGPGPALLGRLFGQAGHRLDPARRRPPGHAARIRLRLLQHGRRTLRPRGPLRVRAHHPVVVGPRRA